MLVEDLYGRLTFDDPAAKRAVGLESDNHDGVARVRGAVQQVVQNAARLGHPNVVAAYSALRPNTTQRCHVVCDARSPVSRFFQIRFVASESTVSVELLRVVRDSASEPR